MDTVEFLKAAKRHCEQRNSDHCVECPLFDLCGVSYGDLLVEDIQSAVEYISDWNNKHPAKTRQSDVLEKFPDAFVDENGQLSVCPKFVSKEFRDQMGFCNQPVNTVCVICKAKYWQTPIE